MLIKHFRFPGKKIMLILNGITVKKNLNGITVNNNIDIITAVHKRRRPKSAGASVEVSTLLDRSAEEDPEVLLFRAEVEQIESKKIEMAVSAMKNGNLPEATRVLTQQEKEEQEEDNIKDNIR